MTKAKSEAAFQEYLDEREPALQRLREALAADGQDPDVLLDGSIESLVPLWRWILADLTRADDPGATDTSNVPREQRHSWARYGYETVWELSLESLFLLDGLVSYLGDVVQQRAPEARWEIPHHRIKRYHLNKHRGPGQRHRSGPQPSPRFAEGPRLQQHHGLPRVPRRHDGQLHTRPYRTAEPRRPAGLG